MSLRTDSAPMPDPAPPHPVRPTVKLLGTRLDRFVEFEFSLADPDLTIELVMPFAAFDEFCAANGAQVLAPEPEAAALAARLAAGHDGRPGLYRAPAAAPGTAG